MSNLKTKTNFLYILSMGSVPVFVNFTIVISAGQFLAKIFFNSKEQSVLSSNQLTGNVTFFFLILSFIIPTFVAYYNFYSIYKEVFFRKQSSFSDATKAKILNVPLIGGLVSFLGWSIGLGVSLQGIWSIEGPSLNLLKWKAIIFNLLNANTSFVFSYYILEIINKTFIRKTFKEENLSELKGTIKIPILGKFFIYYFTIAFTPFLFFINFILTILSENQLVGYYNHLLVFAIFTFTVGILLTFYLAYIFSKPIRELQFATNKIKEGNFDSKIKVDSVDEIAYLGERFNEMSESIKEKEFIKDSFGKAVDPSVRDYLLRGNLVLGGELKLVTVLFVDIQGFTSISEKMSPEEVVVWLNKYFETLSTCIVKEKGLVNKFIGDAVLAVFGAPVPNDFHADSALRAAINMLSEIKKINFDNKKNFPKYKIRIGIHTGNVLAGNIGSNSRMEYTVIGDTVNTASRLESYCKELGLELLFSGNTKRKLKNKIQCKSFGSIQVRGKSKKIEIFSI